MPDAPVSIPEAFDGLSDAQLHDLETKHIRVIGDPDVRFREDPVRMMRAIEFASRLGFEPWRASPGAWASTWLAAEMTGKPLMSEAGRAGDGRGDGLEGAQQQVPPPGSLFGRGERGVARRIRDTARGDDAHGAHALGHRHEVAKHRRRNAGALELFGKR